MEIKPNTTAGWVTGKLPSELAPNAARSVLLFGPDQGGVFEFARLAAGDGDRERVDAKSMDPTDVAASLGSGSLFGGATTVVLDGAGDAQLKKIEEVLEAPFADGARLIVIAGDLKASSKLRKLYQSGKGLVGVPLYALREREIQSFATQYFKSQGLGVQSDARQGLTERLSGDRALAARSCEIVALHAIGRGSKDVALYDVRAVLDAVDEDGLNAPMDHALAANPSAAAKALQLRLASGENFVALLRIFAGRVFRMRDMLATGLSPRDAVAKAKPPIFWAEKETVTRMLSGLSLWKMDRILTMLDRTEYLIIEQGVPANAALSTMILEIAHHKGWKEKP